MPLNPNTVKLGSTFTDNKLSSQPVEYRIHQVERITDEHIVARHIASGNMRTFPLSGAVMKGLDPVPNVPDVQSNLDCMVGKKVALGLRNGGRITGTVTAIRYQGLDCVLFDDDQAQQLRQVQSIELDHSGATSYHWNEVQKISQIK